MSYWPPFQHAETDICLTHLEPFEFRCRVGTEPERRVFVTFDEHTFTRKFTPQDPPEHLCFKNRVFCPVRYGLSLGLRELIETFPDVRVYQTWERDGYVYFAAGVPSPQGPYHVFFSVKRYDFSKKKKGVAMHVQSAYAREKGEYGDGQTTNTIDFARLVENTYMGRSIKFAR
ncbi:hypothetical protein [Brucella sp. NBRC 12950]|uniref:hypothetical protein n=1 Tax=Brucella sp. NBRC 12950 TaxID=2994518 RepID=UPI00255759C2|nr:hypothetical protein [Brucella sp. NBRC 12950]